MPTFEPAQPTDAPQATQTPIDPSESAIEQIAESVDDARESLAEARDRALSQAQTQAERDAINSRFDSIETSVNEMTNRIETAIANGNDRLAGTLTQFLDRLDSRLSSTAGAGDVLPSADDDDILSIEEIAEGVTDPMVDAAAAAGQAVETAIDEAPKRAHMLFRPLFGNKG